MYKSGASTTAGLEMGTWYQVHRYLVCIDDFLVGIGERFNNNN